VIQDPNRASRRAARLHKLAEWQRKEGPNSAKIIEALTAGHVASPQPQSTAWKIGETLSGISAAVGIAADGHLSDVFDFGHRRAYEAMADTMLESLDEAVEEMRSIRGELEQSPYGNLFAAIMLVVTPMREFLVKVENPIIPSERTRDADWIATFGQREVVAWREAIGDVVKKLKALGLGGAGRVSANWLRQADAARVLGKNRGEIAHLVDDGKLKTNGEKGSKCRIDPASLAELQLRLAKRDRAGDDDWASGK
jgi:hypothetical protein